MPRYKALQPIDFGADLGAVAIGGYVDLDESQARALLDAGYLAQDLRPAPNAPPALVGASPVASFATGEEPKPKAEPKAEPKPKAKAKAVPKPAKASTPAPV